MSKIESLLLNTTVVAIGPRALAIEGPPGSGKSSLALALIDRGARLIGDDGAQLVQNGDRVMAHPPPRNKGLLEVRGIGLVKMTLSAPTPLTLILALADESERLPQALKMRRVLGFDIPVLPFVPGPVAPAQRAEWALKTFGLGTSEDSRP